MSEVRDKNDTHLQEFSRVVGRRDSNQMDDITVTEVRTLSGRTGSVPNAVMSKERYWREESLTVS